MAGVNKVVFGNQVAIDISDSTVSPSTLLEGIKAYGANGDPVTGTLKLAYHITLTPEQYAQLTTAEKKASDCWYYLKGVKKAGGLFQRPANSGWELTEDEVTTYNYNSHEVMIAAANGSAYVELQNGWNNISELPSGYAPGSVLTFSAFFEDTTTWVISPIMMRVRPNGLIDVASEGAHNGNLYFSYNYLRENPETDDTWYYTQASNVPYATIDDAHTDASTAWSSSKIVSELSDVNNNIGTAVAGLANKLSNALTLVYETNDAVAVNGTTDLVVPSQHSPLNKAMQIVIQSSFNSDWTYSCRQIIPYIVGANCRYVHNINSSSIGNINYSILDDRTIRIINMTNEAMKFRLYAKYL